MRTGIGTAATIIVAGMAQAAFAQTQQLTLADGRTLSIPATTGRCSPTTGPDAPPPVIVLNLACTVPAHDGQPPSTPGTGSVVMIATPGQPGTVDTYLDRILRGWWPDISAERIATNKTQATKSTSNGVMPMVCIYRDNVDSLNGDAACVLDIGGRLQLVVNGRSTMASTADNVVDAIIAGFSVR